MQISELPPDMMRYVFSYLGVESSKILQICKDWKEYADDIDEITYYGYLSKREKNIPIKYLLNFYTDYLDTCDQSIRKLFDEIGKSKNICVAGGFTTQLYLDKVPDKTSDIDIYFLKTKNNKTEFKAFLDYIKDNFTIKNVGKYRSIIMIQVEQFDHPLQLIFTNMKSITDVFSSFDNSHNKCGFYQNKFYTTYDAKWSKENRKTFFYKVGNNRDVRYQKAEKLGFYICNKNYDEIAEFSAIKYKKIKVKNLNRIFGKAFFSYLAPNWLDDYVFNSNINRHHKMNFNDLNFDNVWYDSSNGICLIEDTPIHQSLTNLKPLTVSFTVIGEINSYRQKGDSILIDDNDYGIEMKLFFLKIGHHGAFDTVNIVKKDDKEIIYINEIKDMNYQTGKQKITLELIYKFDDVYYCSKVFMINNPLYRCVSQESL
jgi:hypothetical protein